MGIIYIGADLLYNLSKLINADSSFFYAQTKEQSKEQSVLLLSDPCWDNKHFLPKLKYRFDKKKNQNICVRIYISKRVEQRDYQNTFSDSKATRQY